MQVWDCGILFLVPLLKSGIRLGAETYLYSVGKRKQFGGWGDDSEIKNNGFSSRGPMFESQHPYSSLTTVHNSSTRGPSAFSWCPWAPSMHMIQIYMQAKYEVLATWLPKHDLNIDDTYRHGNMDAEKLMRIQTWTKSYSQLRNAEIGRNNLPQKRAHQVVIRYQMVRPENIIRVTLHRQSMLYLWI